MSMPSFQIGRIADAQLKAREWAKTFDAVEKKFEVERWVLLALWGMESDFGAEKDRWDVFRSLATLAYVKYRHPYFRNELIVAMRIMQDNTFTRDKMVSSWAGAMGQTQFMPSNFVDYAIDFSGDGTATSGATCRTSGSTANYLRKWKWNPALPWGFEVHVPERIRLHAQPRDFRGMAGARRSPRRRQTFSGFRRGHSFFSEWRKRPGIYRHGKFRCVEGVQQLRCLRGRGRPPRRPHSWRRFDQDSLAERRPAIVTRSPHRACRKNCRSSATK